MRVVHSRSDLIGSLKIAQSEAANAFGVPHCYIEKFIERARHVEFQIMADEHGNAIHLGERECSIPAAAPEAHRRVPVRHHDSGIT